jgi:Ferritin-like
MAETRLVVEHREQLWSLLVEAAPDRFGWPQLIAVTDLASARAALDEIIEQGEGARGDWRPAHYGRFFGIWNDYQKLREQDRPSSPHGRSCPPSPCSPSTSTSRSRSPPTR